MKTRIESLRLGGAIRGWVIAYGIGLTSFLAGQSSGSGQERDPPSGRSLLSMLLLSVVLQGTVLVLRRAVKRYERARGMEGAVSPFATYLFELVVDGVTVALFAVGTFQGLARITSGF